MFKYVSVLSSFKCWPSCDQVCESLWPQLLWPVLLRKLLRQQSMNINIWIAIRLLHARGSPADTADFFGALVEDVADRDGDVDTA